MKHYVPLMMLAALMICPPAKAQKSPTIEQFLSAPFPTELTAAPAKGRVAWVFNAQGVRNIWVAEPASDGSYKSRQLTSYKDDDGQDLGDLSWAPDAETIVYTHGGDLEFPNASYPNPDSSPLGVEQDIWAISWNGAAPKKLGEGHSAAVSPKGGSVAYLFKAQIWLAKLDGSDKPEQLIHANGSESELRWSPDGSKLAFASRRNDHGFIGVYDLSAKSLVYLDPSVDTDTQAAWSPDSHRIAFLRIAVAKGELPFSPRREGQPWSIHIADATTGKGQEIWHADPGTGSVYHEMVADNQLIWTVEDRIVFPWERGGWLHLWSAPVSGGAAKLLTPGNFEVEYVAASNNGREIVYSSNQDDIDRRHVWKVSPMGDHPEAVTSGTGIETEPVMASDNKTIVVLRSDAHTTMRPALAAAKGELRDLAPQSLPADFPANAMVTPQQVILSGTDGMQIHAQLFMPRDAGDGARHPALVFFHGGSRRQMLLGWHYMLYYSNAYAMNQYLASRGYIVLAVNYRSGIGYGLNFREALNYGAAGASEFNDVEGAGLYLRSRPDVDPARIGLWGGSYGGYLTALGLARSSDLFAAGVDMHGVHDWNTEIPTFASSYKPGDRTDFARLAWESSPLSSISTWRSPVLLIQGDDDRNVPFAETVDLAEALRKQGVQFEQLVFPDEIHDFLMHRTWLAAYHASSDFFDKHFKMPEH
ncbi:MAG: prolyl oligopeptidase family serine peptidase [Candidatus Acidiferrum sp.]|jgi:dipeptidyl aminopeptidase/acylaminoacyl peptidase